MSNNSSKIDNSNPPVFDRFGGQRRVFCVYIDGGNLYHRIRTSSIDERKFDYRGFVDWLCGESVETVRYYVAQIRRESSNLKSHELYAEQQKRFERLKKAGFYIIRGRFLKMDGNYVEKGVDVRIGVDIATGALMDKYDTALVISSDGDLAPAIEHAVRNGKKEIIYVGIEGSKISYHLIQEATSTRMVKKDEMLKFVLE